MRLAPVLLSNAMLLVGLIFLDWAAATVAVFFWLEAAAQGFAALVDAQAGKWRPAEAARGP